MPHYKDTENKLYFLDSSEFEHLLPAGCVQISDEEAKQIEISNHPQTTIAELISNIDNLVASIYQRFTRFETEYLQRENAAKEYLADNTISPSIYLTSFTMAAGKTNSEAANIIVTQANTLRSVMQQLAALRMRKYELYYVSIEQAKLLADSILAEINSVAALVN